MKIPINHNFCEGGNPMTRIAITSHCERRRSNPVLKIPIIILLGLAMTMGLAPSMAQAGLRETLAAKLSEYCIPKDELACESELLPRYQNSACYCGEYMGTYMTYNAETRLCDVICPAGQIPEKVSGCDGGYGGLVIKDF